MKMPRAYPTWSRMWMIPNFFSHLERKEKATYLTVLWKGRLFVEFDSFCRSENACEIDEIFLFLETTIEILSFVSWVPECLNEQRFCISQKEKSQNIVEKDKKNVLLILCQYYGKGQLYVTASTQNYHIYASDATGSHPSRSTNYSGN